MSARATLRPKGEEDEERNRNPKSPPEQMQTKKVGGSKEMKHSSLLESMEHQTSIVQYLKQRGRAQRGAGVVILASSFSSLPELLRDRKCSGLFFRKFPVFDLSLSVAGQAECDLSVR